MIETVLLFGLANTLFEIILLGMMPVKMRLSVLGSATGRRILHFSMLVVTLWVHWGTLTGTMGAVVAFIFSFPAVLMAQGLWGYIYVTPGGDRRLRRGIINYQAAELQ